MVIYFLILTELIRFSVEFCVDEVFKIPGNYDIKGSKETQKLKLGDAKGIPN